ncbi:hypothetical protein C7271_19925 [filamentous cyanobacterium CCP5]|nr:hypothetical protein C7271_19925 [filamentous cyanobacterium CCP5]
MTQRRNRNRSKRRGIFCPTHSCYLDSVSQKYPLYADRAEQLQQRGMSRRKSVALVANGRVIPLSNEWLEAFWCDQCQATCWYQVKRQDARTYSLSPAPSSLWQQVSGVIHPAGNPSVGEFTRTQARANVYGKGSRSYMF